MRLDKYLKTSRIIKRRSIASQACTAGKVLVNGKVAKPSCEANVGDIIEITFGEKKLCVKIEIATEHATKQSTESMYSIIQ